MLTNLLPSISINELFISVLLSSTINDALGLNNCFGINLTEFIGVEVKIEWVRAQFSKHEDSTFEILGNSVIRSTLLSVEISLARICVEIFF